MSPNRWEMPPVFLRSGNPETENEPTLQYKGQLGMRFTIQNPIRTAPDATTGAGMSKTYQLVKTDSTMAVSPFNGAVAWWSDKTQYLVTTTVTTLGRGRIAGVFRTAVTPGNYCCVQTEGPSPVKFVDAPTANPTVAGLFVIPSATNAKADCLAAGSAATYPALGVSSGVYDAVNAQAMVNLDVPQTT